MEKYSLQDLAMILGASTIATLFIYYLIVQSAHKIKERVIQQHETNRLLRKLAGEPEIFSSYLNEAREHTSSHVSTAEDTAKPLPSETIK